MAYVKNVPSNVHLKIPAAALMAKGIGRHIYVYAMDRDTFGVSTLLLEEWNKRSLLRMNCEYETDNGHVIAKLPERLVQWYKIDGFSDSNHRLIEEPDKTRVRVELAR